MSEANPSPEAAPDVSIRARPPSPKRLSRKVLMGAALFMGGLVAFALVYGLSGRADRREAAEAQQNAASAPPDTIRMAPQNYDASDVGGGRQTNGAGAASSEALAPPEDAMWSGGRRRSQLSASASNADAPDPDAAARAAPILFSQAQGASAASGAGPAVETGRHGAFLASQRSGGGDGLVARLTPPRSRYELLAGAVIAAALQTELNSDLPGRILAQVTAPVYDSVTGETLLIPQGARLIGAYDNAAAYGDERLLLVWNRLILPNGWSIDLQGMEGADASGAAGLSDRTDNHLARLGAAIGLSAIVSVIANRSENNNDRHGLTQNVGDAAAQQAAESGGRIVDRELAVHPTLTVRAGAPVRVLITRDIVLRPYRE